MSSQPPEVGEDYPVYDPADDPHSFEPKPIYNEPNETYEEVEDA